MRPPQGGGGGRGSRAPPVSHRPVQHRRIPPQVLEEGVVSLQRLEAQLHDGFVLVLKSAAGGRPCDEHGGLRAGGPLPHDVLGDARAEHCRNLHRRLRCQAAAAKGVVGGA